MQKVLRDIFGLESFREGQEEVIQSVVDGNDTLVFMPTGGGKSLTYQLPGYMREGLVMVISPLISLMKDQVDKLHALGLRADLINSTISLSEQQMILQELQEISPPSPLSFGVEVEKPKIKYLYIAPERLGSQKFLNAIQNIKISLIAIDEAHCISQWGHDFRPSYMKIQGFIEGLRKEKNFPVVALTATATKKVRADIVERLGLEKYNSFIAGFDRKNIIIIVREISKKEEKLDKLSEILIKTPGAGIIYCSSRKVTKEVYEYLDQNDIRVGMYTGEMNAADRDDVQNKFMNDELKVIVATNAFGMGIDKKDIRFVVHYNLPGSIENYYQEVGRAGRDGKNSYGIVLASYGDTKIQEFFIENTYPTKEEILQFYEYLYQPYYIGGGKGESILKTYYVMASESGLQNDMKVGSIVKVLEKYGIVKRGYEGNDENFRGRGITLNMGKVGRTQIPVDWQRQELLKEEGYYKLDQIKKLLFFPSCRKRFILEYFGDEEDLKKLGESCGVCDYCLDKKNLESGVGEKIVPLSVFDIVLDAVSEFDKKFGAKLIINFLWGSSEKRILEWRLETHKMYGALGEYNSEIVEGLIEALIRFDYLEKTPGKFPLLGLTKVGKAASKNEAILREDEDNLQSYLSMKCKNLRFKKQGREKLKKKSKPKGETYTVTLNLLKQDYSNSSLKGEGIIKHIAELRNMSPQTIESHVVTLYSDTEMSLTEILKFVSFSNLALVEQVITGELGGEKEKLKPIKDKLEELGKKEVSYFEIKVAIAMMEKGDL